MQPIRSDRDRLTAALSTVGGSDEVMVIPGPFLPELLAQFVVPAKRWWWREERGWSIKLVASTLAASWAFIRPETDSFRFP
jgi:hypothetical protein